MYNPRRRPPIAPRYAYTHVRRTPPCHAYAYKSPRGPPTGTHVRPWPARPLLGGRHARSGASRAFPAWAFPRSIPPTTFGLRERLGGSSPCDIAADQRERLAGLLAAGKLDRTVRVIEHADALCPTTASSTWVPLITTLAELGRGEDVRQVATRIESRTQASEEARTAAKPTPS